VVVIDQVDVRKDQTRCKTVPICRWSNQLGKIILTASQLAQCPALNETPDCGASHMGFVPLPVELGCPGNVDG